jgi:hypothetical protein
MNTAYVVPKSKMNHIRERKKEKEKEKKGRTNTDNSSIFRFFILCRNGRWTEGDEGDEEEEDKGEGGEEARGMFPRWAGHVQRKGK